MKKIVKVLILLGIILGLGLHSSKVNADAGDGFKNVPAITNLEAGSNFSTTQWVRLVENGQQKAFSVYLYKSKTGYRKVNNTHFIDRRVNGTYMLRYESASGKHKAWRKVVVKDTKAPVFTGISNKTINQYSKFSTTSGIKAYDLAEGKKGYSVYLWKNKTGYRKISKKHYINTKYPGKYQLKYVVKDRKGNTSIRYRKITVKAVPKKKVTKKVVKTAGKAKVSTIKRGKTITIYPKLDNDRGFWYTSNVNKFYVHSAFGESLNNFNKGDIVKFKINGRWYTYQIYDKFICFGTKNTYPGVPTGKDLVAPSRGKSMKRAIEQSPLSLQTCQDWGYSKIKVCLARPYGNSAKWDSSKNGPHYNPQ